LSQDSLEEIEAIVHDGEIAQNVLDASLISMGNSINLGQELSEIDT
jgi:hypothetical protein